MKNIEEEKPLTAREKEILNLLGLGKSRRIIAIDLGIEVHTLDTHLKNIRLKTNIKSLNGLAILGYTSYTNKNENK